MPLVFMASSASTLSWLWVIEALASFKEVDVSILIDLVKRTPEVSDDSGKNAREMICLRILESFVSQRIRSKKGVSSPPYSKIEFDPSQDCEDVVRHILHEISASNLGMDEPEILKWDIQTFITHKRARLPKCMLLQLKNAILEGNHPNLSSLKGRSGLSINKPSDNGIAVNDSDLNAVAVRLERSCSDGPTMAGENLTSPNLENSDGLLQNDSQNLLPSKRDRSDRDTENQAARSHEDYMSMGSGCDPKLHNAKKLKQNSTFTTQAVGQKSSSIAGNEPSKDLSRGNGQPTVTASARLDLAEASPVGGLEESRISDGDHDQHIASKRPGQRSDSDDAGLQHNHPQISCDNSTGSQDTSGDGVHHRLLVNEAKDDGQHCAEMGVSNATEPQDTPRTVNLDLSPNEAKDDGQNCAEMKTSNAASPHRAHQNIFGNEARDQHDKSQLHTSNGAVLDGSHQNDLLDEAKDDMVHNRGQEMSSDSDGYHDERFDVAMKKRIFLSSQCTFSQDSLAAADFSELTLCMKCNKGGQLLVCSASACPLVVHQSCLCSAPYFGESGKFYCPFCAYSRAISEYLETKKKASLARKDLAAFIGLANGHQASKLSKRSRPERNQLMQDGNVNGDNQAKNNGNHANEVSSSQYRENREDQLDVEPSVSCVNRNLPCGEEIAIVNDGAVCVATEGNKEGGEMGPESQSATVLEGQQIEARAGCKPPGDNLSGRDTDIVHVKKKYTEDAVQREVSQQLINDSPQQAPCPPNVDAEESSGEENDKAISKYSIRFRKREKQHTYPAVPQLRRKKVPWTAVEEEKLKEGVRILASVQDRNIPWKRILEFGSGVFEKGRTTIDLKDKWRNICKGSPKPK